MRRYLSQLHKKPDHHKRQFALLASGTITLAIFGIWSLATFGTSKGSFIGEIQTSSVAETSGSEVSPFQSLRSSLADTFNAVKGSLGELKKNIESTDLEGKYKEMKAGALDTYGQ